SLVHPPPLSSLFPYTTLFRSRVLAMLDGHSALRAWRRSTYWAIKSLDTYLLGNSKYIILIDPDVLFFRRPAELFERDERTVWLRDRKSTRLNSSHVAISYAVF